MDRGEEGDVDGMGTNTLPVMDAAMCMCTCTRVSYSRWCRVNRAGHCALLACERACRCTYACGSTCAFWMYVYMYVCTHIRTCMYACTCMCKWIHEYVRTYACGCMLCGCTYVRMDVMYGCGRMCMCKPLTLHCTLVGKTEHLPASF